MDITERLADRLAIERLNHDFGYHLDHGGEDAFVDLFTPDAIYRSGAAIRDGHETIRAFFADRAAAGRLSRHVLTGLRIDFLSLDRATGTSVGTTYAADGPAPVRSTAPFLVGDIADVYVRTDKWRIAERRITAVFLAA